MVDVGDGAGVAAGVAYIDVIYSVNDYKILYLSTPESFAVHNLNIGHTEC